MIAALHAESYVVRNSCWPFNPYGGDASGTEMERNYMYRSLRLLFLILGHFSTAVFLWPLSTFVFSRRLWETTLGNPRDGDVLRDESPEPFTELEVYD